MEYPPADPSNILSLNIMIKLYMLLASVTFFSSSITAQHTDKKEYGLKGDIKKIQSTGYQLIQGENGKYYPEDTAKWYLKEHIFFNEQGNVDSTYNIFNRKYYLAAKYITDTTSLIQTWFARKYYYDEEGRKSGGFEYNFDNPGKTSIILISWVNENQYIEVKMNTYNEKVESVDSVWLNKNGRDSIGIGYYDFGEGLKIYHAYYASYNDANQLTQQIDVDFNPDLQKIYTYEFKKLDKTGNPVETWVFKKDEKKPIIIKLRKYKYY